MLGCRAILSFGCLLSFPFVFPVPPLRVFFCFFSRAWLFFCFACLQTHSRTTYMLQCSLMLLVHSVLATAAFCGNEKEIYTESAPSLSSPVEMLHGVWRHCSEMPHHHARGRGTECPISFCVCCCGCGCGRAGLVGTMAAACVCRSVLSGDMPRRFPMCVASGTMCCGGCAIAEWRERSGRKCVSTPVRSRAGFLAAEGIAHPTQHRSCRALYITPQHRSRHHQHAARQRMPPPPRVRPEGNTSAVAFRGGTPCGTVACPKPHRGVCTRHWALTAECLCRGGPCG
ncbi:hypothetical protein TcCL_Unassigned02933 [Trypanosoma cruzi]|nr:hypothetical protein TcCL_Unassigned02933 [Trypanosoma cruzi]